MADKILFITSNRLGDAVLSMGLLNYICEAYPERKITVACGPLATSLFEGCPQVESIISLKKEKRSGHWVKLWKQAVTTPWAMVIDLRNSAVSRLLMAKERYIYGPSISKDQHKVEQNAEVMKLNEVPSPRLWPSAEQAKKAEEFIPKKENKKNQEVLAVGPAANWIGKTWPADRFIEVIETITAEGGLLPNARVAVFAAPGEEEVSYQVLKAVPEERQIDMIAKADPGTVAATIARCDLYIGNDSGLMHCAAAAGIPTFGLFGPSYPKWYAPWGEHTDYARTPETFDELIDFDGYDPTTLKHTLMKSLTTEKVLSTLTEFWQGLEQSTQPAEKSDEDEWAEEVE
ncbi:MAG: glycosyltransferase 9 family protein [Micavibrio sp.]|nr:glycosyltransferase 9 family protein [Micavibrio sp.]HCK33133.1 glycosyltransferase family 9 protein [Rhodospirillaceae bacterium]|tara:strand:- start:1320 stop:2354 length:1035 start_codon:yes stop_codon:yes gene_type:complete